jgi:hypothetical protein
MYRQLKKRTYDILEGHNGSPAGRWLITFLLTLIALNVIAVILETVESLSTKYSALFFNFEIFSIAVFTLEYTHVLRKAGKTAVSQPNQQEPSGSGHTLFCPRWLCYIFYLQCSSIFSV